MTFHGDGYCVLFERTSEQFHALVYYAEDHPTPYDIALWRDTPQEIFTALRAIPELREDFSYPCWDRITW